MQLCNLYIFQTQEIYEQPQTLLCTFPFLTVLAVSLASQLEFSIPILQVFCKSNVLWRYMYHSMKMASIAKHSFILKFLLENNLLLRHVWKKWSAWCRLCNGMQLITIPIKPRENCFWSQCCLQYTKQRIWDHRADYAIYGTPYLGLKG